MTTVNSIRTMVEPLGYKYTINLDRDITSPEDFQEELLTIRSAKEGDVIHILLSCAGGSVETMKCFLSAMEQSPAGIITEVTGDIASAATFIFLAGHEYRVSDNAELMFHSSFFGAAGKCVDVKRQVDFTHKANERLIRKYYQYFFTEEELSELLEGKEFWMDSEETMERLENRRDLYESSEDIDSEVGYDDYLSQLDQKELRELLKSVQKHIEPEDDNNGLEH